MTIPARDSKPIPGGGSRYTYRPETEPGEATPAQPMSEERIQQIRHYLKTFFTTSRAVCVELLGEVERLRAAIREHRSQKFDDRCIEDDDRLYEALGDGIKCDRRIGDPQAMHANCWRFIQNRCEAGGPWKSYVELEGELAALNASFKAMSSDICRTVAQAMGGEYRGSASSGVERLASEIDFLRRRIAELERGQERASGT